MEQHRRPPRRRSPSWVREWPSKAIHAVLGRFDRMRRTQDLSDAQEWLYDACISELQYRRRIARPTWTACSCWYCFEPVEPGDGPFDDG